MKNKKFEMYFLEYKDLVIRIAMDKLGNYHAAQEICQQVFASFYTSMSHVSPELVKAWLIRCTQNAVIDYSRRWGIKREIPSDVEISDAGSSLIEKSVELYQEKLNDRELGGRILREVKSVNEQWFEVLILHCLEGLPYSEISEKLHVPETVLRARMYRARLFIKERFGDEYYDRKS